MTWHDSTGPNGPVRTWYYTGPPPEPPRPVRLTHPSTAVHLIMTGLSMGIWLPIWILAVWSADASNNRENVRFRQQRYAYEHAREEWQRAEDAAYQDALQRWRWQQDQALHAAITGPAAAPAEPGVSEGTAG